jgi:hypothetical protein
LVHNDKNKHNQQEKINKIETINGKIRVNGKYDLMKMDSWFEARKKQEILDFIENFDLVKPKHSQGVLAFLLSIFICILLAS